MQSLVMVYAQLMHSSLEAVLGFLSSVPGPTGQSALHFVMSEWVARQPLFYGAYESKAGVYPMLFIIFSPSLSLPPPPPLSLPPSNKANPQALFHSAQHLYDL
jgi:hypothetical protein